MRLTLGEIANLLLPYSNTVDLSTVNGVPFLRARISSASAFTKCYLYVVQTGEHEYASADSSDDINGDRFFPTGGITHPFVVETDIVRSMFGCIGDDISYKYDSVVTGLNFESFIAHLHERLSYYDIIRFDSKNFDIRIIDMGFTSTRIKRTIEKEFDDKKCHQGTIKDLVDIILRRKERFSLGNLKDREVKVIIAKLRDLGITITIDDDNCISSLKFDKRKGG